MKPASILIVLVLVVAVAGGVAAQETPLNVVATTTLVADVAAQRGGDLVVVSSLLPPDTDTHAYQFTPQDVARVSQADLLLVVGAGYETFLGRLLESAGEIPSVVVSEGVAILPVHAEDDETTAGEPLGVLGQGLVCEGEEDEAAHDGVEHHDHAHGVCDPHVWMDPANVMIWAENIAAAFAAVDPINADVYRANAVAYIAELEALDAELRALVETLPRERRMLVTNHVALNYFAHAYDFDIVATVLPGVSTGAELSPQALIELVELLRAQSVPVIFAEVTANLQLAQLAAQEAGVTLVADLYTEALSDAGGPAATYIDFMRHNTRTIVEALGE